jgi:hypothetical protein
VLRHIKAYLSSRGPTNTGGFIQTKMSGTRRSNRFQLHHDLPKFDLRLDSIADRGAFSHANGKPDTEADDHTDSGTDIESETKPGPHSRKVVKAGSKSYDHTDSEDSVESNIPAEESDMESDIEPDIESNTDIESDIEPDIESNIPDLESDIEPDIEPEPDFGADSVSDSSEDSREKFVIRVHNEVNKLAEELKWFTMRSRKNKVR